MRKTFLCIFMLLICSVSNIRNVEARGFIGNSSTISTVLEQYNDVFIETGFIKEFYLVDGKMKCKQDIQLMMEKYEFNESDQKFIKQLIDESNVNSTVECIRKPARVKVKNGSILLNKKEVRKYFKKAITIGPIAIVGAMIAIGATVGPVGAIAACVASTFSSSYIATNIKKAYVSNKGLKICLSGISVY